MSVCHSFDVDHAEEYGLAEAILIRHFKDLICESAILGRDLKWRKTWVRQTQKEILSVFPYFSDYQLRKVLKSLVDQKVLVTGKFNEHKMDNSTWYAFKSEEKFGIEENQLAIDRVLSKS